MILALGIDPSLSSTGVAGVLVDGDRVRGSVALALKPPKRQSGISGEIRRLLWFRDEMKGIRTLVYDPLGVSWQIPIVAALEGYAFGARNMREKLGELGGLIKLGLVDAGIPFTIVPPTSLKKFVSGKGNAPKDMVRLEAYRRFEVDEVTSDEVEAACLARMLAVGMGWLVPDLPKKHLEALGKVKWPDVKF